LKHKTEPNIAIGKYRTIHTNVASSLQILLSLLSQQTRATSSRHCRLHCQPPKVLNEERCRCECLETHCPPHRLDPNTCSCRPSCPPRHCLPPKTFNRNTCECECSNHCPPNSRQNPTTCRCECLEDLSCPPPDREWNSETCQCDCVERQCAPNETFNHENCQCQCRQRQRDCPQNKTLNRDTCQCECRSSPHCRSGMLFNRNTCECQCRPRSCGARKTLNPNTCECECSNHPVSCLGRWVFNNDTCECQCRSSSCPGNQILHPILCKCGCRDGRIGECPKGQVFDRLSCKCSTPAHCQECSLAPSDCNRLQRVDLETCSCECVVYYSRNRAGRDADRLLEGVQPFTEIDLGETELPQLDVVEKEEAMG
jgi:hypothetical protein